MRRIEGAVPLFVDCDPYRGVVQIAQTEVNGEFVGPVELSVVQCDLPVRALNDAMRIVSTGIGKL